MDIDITVKKLNDSITIENSLIKCFIQVKEEYLKYKENFENEIFNSSKNIISNLELVNAYITKHNEVKTIYKSYKTILLELLEYKKKMQVLARMSKPLIPESRMKILLDEQKRMMGLVRKMDTMFKDKDEELLKLRIDINKE